jgi:hypothetical protein
MRAGGFKESNRALGLSPTHFLFPDGSAHALSSFTSHLVQSMSHVNNNTSDSGAPLSERTWPTAYAVDAPINPEEAFGAYGGM